MATMTNTQINELAEVSQGFIPQAAEAPLRNFLSLAPTTSVPYIPRQERPLLERSPSGFLTLAPSTSASYPRLPASRHQSISHLIRPLPLTPGSVEEQPNPFATRSMSSASIAISEPKSRRSSSISSEGSQSSGKSRLRFLKLGPVHWGEHQGDHKEDWHEIDEEAISP